MAESVDDARLQQWLDSPYQPEMGTGVDAQERIAKATEYSAHQLYQIRQKLDELIKETAQVEATVEDGSRGICRKLVELGSLPE